VVVCAGFPWVRATFVERERGPTGLLCQIGCGVDSVHVPEADYANGARLAPVDEMLCQFTDALAVDVQ
jgi:hypothetical protein